MPAYKEVAMPKGGDRKLTPLLPGVAMHKRASPAIFWMNCLSRPPPGYHHETGWTLSDEELD